MTDHDLTAMIDAYLDGNLAPDAFAALSKTLREDPAAAQTFAHRSIAHRALRQLHTTAPEAAAPSGATESATHAPGTAPLSAAGVPMYRKGYEPQPFKLRAHHFAFLAATLLAACGLAAYLLTASVDPKPDPVDPNQPPAPVATLIQNTGDLRTPHGYPAEGDDYGRGEYTLSTGTAEFMLTNAVNVKLRGDTRMVMRNNMNVALTRGSAAFVCPKGAAGFTVHLPDQSKIVDLGTAFKVELDDDGRSKLRVTQGAVQWTGTTPDAEPVLIVAGQNARLVDGHAVVSAPLQSQLGVLDLNANGGLNPATGEPWEAGDTYRLIFTTSGLTPATSSDIDFYNAFVQDAADATEAFAIGTDDGVTWKAIVSTESVDARDNTDTNIATDDPGEAIFLLDGKTLVAEDYASLYGPVESHANTIHLTELNTTPVEIDYGSVWTGSDSKGVALPGEALGAADGTSYVGLWKFTTGAHWITRFGDTDQSKRLPLYAISQPLVITEQAPAPVSDVETEPESETETPSEDAQTTESDTQSRQRAGDKD